MSGSHRDYLSHTEQTQWHITLKYNHLTILSWGQECFKVEKMAMPKEIIQYHIGQAEAHKQLVVLSQAAFSVSWN